VRRGRGFETKRVTQALEEERSHKRKKLPKRREPTGRGLVDRGIRKNSIGSEYEKSPYQHRVEVYQSFKKARAHRLFMLGRNEKGPNGVSSRIKTQLAHRDELSQRSGENAREAPGSGLEIKTQFGGERPVPW